MMYCVILSALLNDSFRSHLPFELSFNRVKWCIRDVYVYRQIRASSVAASNESACLKN